MGGSSIGGRGVRPKDIRTKAHALDRVGEWHRVDQRGGGRGSPGRGWGGQEWREVIAEGCRRTRLPCCVWVAEVRRVVDLELGAGEGGEGVSW